ncbi:hypothetical protein, partial [Escherichia coli]|uniref:hypothetical protein n=1 Tax=Escherichia coli TaxID=562 RepID=UPI00215A82C6
AVVGIGVVEARGDAPTVVDAVGHACGADPLLATLGTAVAAPFQLALPIGVGRGAPAGNAGCAPLDHAAARALQFAIG